MARISLLSPVLAVILILAVMYSQSRQATVVLAPHGAKISTDAHPGRYDKVDAEGRIYGRPVSLPLTWEHHKVSVSKRWFLSKKQRNPLFTASIHPSPFDVFHSAPIIEPDLRAYLHFQSGSLLLHKRPSEKNRSSMRNALHTNRVEVECQSFMQVLRGAFNVCLSARPYTESPREAAKANISFHLEKLFMPQEAPQVGNLGIPLEVTPSLPASMVIKGTPISVKENNWTIVLTCYDYRYQRIKRLAPIRVFPLDPVRYRKAVKIARDLIMQELDLGVGFENIKAYGTIARTSAESHPETLDQYWDSIVNPLIREEGHIEAGRGRGWLTMRHEESDWWRVRGGIDDFKSAADPCRRTLLRNARQSLCVSEDRPGTNQGKIIERWVDAAGLRFGEGWDGAFVYRCVPDDSCQRKSVDRFPAVADAASVLRWAKAHQRLYWPADALRQLTKLRRLEAEACPSGDVFLLLDQNSSPYHIGIVTKFNPRSFSTVEGNSDVGLTSLASEVAEHVRPYRGVVFVRMDGVHQPLR